jgi:signal transduction histidine kinase
MELRIRRKDGQWRWVESTASNLLNEPHVGAVAINYREITRRRAEAEEKQRLVQELMRANAELQDFAHSVAHDLREPLRTMSAFTELLLRRAKLQPADQILAQFMVDGVARMTALLDHLLSSATSAFNRSLEPVNLEHAAVQAMRNLSTALGASQAVVKLTSLPVVRGRESDLVRVFQNLLSNAAKYRSQAALQVEVSAERLGPDWVVRVHDNGIGIPEAEHRRVFGLFMRAEGDHEGVPGSGVGLALCKRLVEGMGGEIWVESTPGAGSTFCFTVAAG